MTPPVDHPDSSSDTRREGEALAPEQVATSIGHVAASRGLFSVWVYWRCWLS